MRAIWEPANKYRKWLEVELAVADALAEIGRIPKDAAQALRRNAILDPKRVEELEGETPSGETGKAKPGSSSVASAKEGSSSVASAKEGSSSVASAKEGTRHDLMAFLEAVSENLGPERKYLHFGVTSYDIEDTALGLLLRESAELLDKDIQELIEAVSRRAVEHKYTPMMGRTHGVHAEPMTFGLKLAVWVAALRRARERLRQAKKVVSCGKISGAVGAYGNIDPRVETIVCNKLGLKQSEASTQILQRDRHAQYISSLAVLAASLEQFATEIRNLQRTEIREVEEPFRAGQKGSSAMPHKRNPMVCERITGLARIVRSHLLAALENVATWHERDLTQSSVERLILPDSNILCDYMLRKFREVVDGMVVYPERMMENLNRLKGLVFSEAVMLALVDKGLDRSEAYTIVQENAMRMWESISSPLEGEDTGGGADFRQTLEKDERVARKLSPQELADCFDLARHLKHVDVVFERLGLNQ
jgi:adenylosuccinate lyase